jgi:menaquinone-9 beta-reductase
MEERWDVVIVGARCAGATLATLLARGGRRVLVLEASSRGTDMPMSTHFLQPPGMDVLDRLGVGERVRAVTPAAARFRYALDEAESLGVSAPGREGRCVRRATLDPWLQDAAEQAGATLRFRQRVMQLTRSGERVTGVVVRTPEGSRTIHADLVVGADGQRSVVASEVGAEAYLTSPLSRGGYWAYHRAPARWDYAWDSTLEHRGRDVRYVFRCDGDQVILVYAGPIAEVQSWGRERDTRLAEALAASPATRALAEAPRLGPPTGILEATSYYRRPIGPGWALVGDAGHFKDYITGQGMTDAFLDAERLADAVLDGREAAFQAYWRGRDALTLPLHQDAVRQGEVGYNEPFMRWVVSQGFAQSPALRTRMMAMIDRKLRPDQLIPMGTLLGLMARALVRGRFDVLRGFFAFGRPLAAEAKERARRSALYAEARELLAAAPAAPPRLMAPASTTEMQTC